MYSRLIRQILFSTIAISFFLAATVDGQKKPDDSSVARAKELWEMAIAAKGGREKLNQISSFADYDSPPFSVEFIVLPDRYFHWADLRPGEFGLDIEVLNFERNTEYNSFATNPPKVSMFPRPSQKLRSRITDAQLRYFLETRWFKPEVVRSFKDKVNKRPADVVIVNIERASAPTGYDHSDIEVGVFLDEKTHLPIRLADYSISRREMFNYIDFDKYEKVKDIMVPTMIRPANQKWAKLQLEINPSYDPGLFDHGPGINGGAFQWRKQGGKNSSQ